MPISMMHKASESTQNGELEHPGLVDRSLKLKPLKRMIIKNL